MGKAFKGGIVLTGKPAKELVTEELLPEKAVLSVPDGYECTCRNGDSVRRGDVIARGENGSVPVLSSISGSAEVNGSTVKVTSDGKNELSEECRPLEKEISGYTREELRSTLIRMGVNVPEESKKKTGYFIIDCVENDSYVSSATRLILEEPEKIIGGAKILMYLYGAKKGICAVSSAMLRCADILDAECAGTHSLIKVRLVSRKFPQQEPHMLISTLLDLEINTTINTSDAGYTVVTPELCAAAYRALGEGVPNTSRIVTVAGDCTGFICNMTVPFGTSVRELLEHCGGIILEPSVILCGGVMSGKVLDYESTVDADTAAVTALSKGKLPETPDSLNCIGCGKCAAACPVRLLPSFIHSFAEKGDVRSCISLDIDCCIGCGCCTAVCPSGIDLAESIVRAQNAVNEPDSAAAVKTAEVKTSEAETGSSETGSTEKTPGQSKSDRLRNAIGVKLPPTRRMSAALRSPETVLTVSMDIVIALLPLFAWAVYLYGMRPVTVAVISAVSCYIFDALLQFILHRTVTLRDVSPAVTGLIIALGMPPTVPLWLPVIAAAVSSAVRHVNRRCTYICVDPAVFSLASLSIVFSGIMSTVCKAGSKLPAFAVTVTGFARETESAVEVLRSGSMPSQSVGSMFVGMRGGLMGEVSALLLIISAVYLICRRIIRPGLPIAFTATAFLLSYLLPQVPIVSDMIALDFALYEILAGDLLYCAVIMASSAYIAPISSRAGVVSGVLGGGITVLMRFLPGAKIPVLCAMLVMSVISRLLDSILRPAVFGGRTRKNRPASSD